MLLKVFLNDSGDKKNATYKTTWNVVMLDCYFCYLPGITSKGIGENSNERNGNRHNRGCKTTSIQICALIG